MTEPSPTGLNPFERIRSTEGKVCLLLCGLAAIPLIVDLAAAHGPTDRRWLAVEAAAMLAYIAIGTCGTMRIVARPVRRAKRHFEAIGNGDYTRPVLTRRTDEFGDMLRGLEQMRQKLVAAVSARDAAERKSRDIVERSVQGFYQITPDGDFLDVNEALARMLGYDSKAQLLAEPPGLARRMHVDQARRAAFVADVRRDGRLTGFEVALRRRDGGVIWLSESARSVVDTQSGIEYLEGFVDDITERKEAEQLKSDFVSFVTHQLRTPLSGIRWMLELAQQSDLAPDAASFVDDAHASTHRLIGLVNDLLDVARLESGRLITEASPVDLREITAGVVTELAPLAAAKRLSVKQNMFWIPPVLIDRQLARQAVLNLIANAIKYTPDGGEIAIGASRDSSHVRWTVRDTGIGISVAAQRHLFEKFYRADNAVVVDTEGTGLGLYLVRLIAERSGGSVTCESAEGVGSTFILRLPIADDQRAAA